jgi:hypothetical protein
VKVRLSNTDSSRIKNSMNGTRRIIPGQPRLLSHMDGSNHRRKANQARDAKDDEKRTSKENGDAETGANRTSKEKQVDQRKSEQSDKSQNETT